MAESYSVTAVLSAVDKNFSSVFGSAQGAADSLAGKLKSGLGFGVMQAVGIKAVSAVTSAISGMAGGIVDAGMTFDASMSQVAATMGKSVSDIEDLRDFAQQMGATTAFSATEAAEALNYMALAGYDSATSMEMLPNVLNLAAAGNMDLARASDMVTDTQTAFGLKMEEMPRLIDEMAKAASTGNTSVEQLGDAFLTVGGLAQELNGGFVTLADGTQKPVDGVQELEIALTAMANAGVKGSEAGTHMRNMLLKLSSPASEGVAALKKMGVSVFDLEGNMRSLSDIFGDLNDSMSGMTQEQKIQTIADLFNTRDLASAEALLNAVGEDWDKIGASILDADGAAEQMANTQLDNLSGDVTLFQSALEGLRISIFDNFNGPMRAAVKIATEGLTELKGVVDNLGDVFGGAFDLSEISDALETGGLTGALDVVAGSLDRLPDGFKAAAAAAGGLAGVSLVNGFLDSGVWKAGIAGVGTFRDVMGMLPGAVKMDAGVITGKIADIGNGLVNITSKTLPNVLTNMSAAGDAAKKAGDKVSGMFGRAKEATIGKFTKAFPNLTAAMRTTTREAGKAASGILGTFGKMGSGLTKVMGLALKAVMPAAIIGAALAGLGVLYSKFGPQIDQILNMVAQKGPEIITNLVNGITSRLPDLIASGAQMVSGILTAITANLPALIQGGVSLIQSLVMGVSSSASMLITKGIELIGTLVVSIASAIPQLITTGMELLASLAQGVGQNLPMLVQYAMQAIMTFVQGIITNLPQILASAAQIVSSLTSGITNSLPVLISQGIQLITYLAQAFIQNLPLIIQTGVQVIASLVKGLIQAVPMIIQGAIELVKSLIDTIIHTDWIKVGGDIISAIGNGIKAGFGGLGDMISGLFSSDTSAAEGAAQQASAAAESTAQAYIDSSSYVADAAAQVGTEAQDSLTSSLEGVDISGIMEMMGSDGADAFTSSMSAIDLSGIGTAASDTVTMEFDSGMAELPGIADNAGSQVVSSLQQTGSQAAASAKQTSTGVVNALKAGVGPAKSAGKSVGSGYAGGIRGESASASSAGSAVKNSALGAMSGGYGSAYSHGSNIGQGLVDGINSKVGAAWSAANSLAAAADKAIHARAQIGSPSKITIRYGKWIGEGLAVGIKSAAHGVIVQAKSLIDKLYKQMSKSTKKLGSVKDAASTYLKAFRTGLQDKAKSDLEYVENSLKKYRDVSKSYNAAVTALMKSYKTAFNKEVDRIISDVSTKLTKLANTYQTKYSNIVNAQKDFRETLQDTSLYTADDYGNIALADFTAQTNAIKQYSSNIAKLKKLLPDSLMDEILGMSRENGLAYTNEILKKSTEWIKEYGRQYAVMLGTGSNVASTYYSSRLTDLQKNYAADLKKIYAESKKDMNSIGKNVVDGLISGMSSKKGALDATGRSLAKAVEDAFKKQLKIKSPSRVMTDAGEDTGQGVINGIENKVRAARAAMSRLISVTSPEAAMSRRSEKMNLSDEYEYKSEAHYHITVETNLDGKKVGEGCAEFVGDAINRKNEREERKRGRRK